MKVIFVSTNSEFIDAVKERFQGFSDIQYHLGDVLDIPVQGKAFISPSNSLGFMDSGIDFVLSRKMFPGVESEVRNKIKALEKYTLIGRPYLPIGSSIIVPTQYLTSCLISAPTMFLPHDVSMTNNAYHAFMSALCVFNKYTVNVSLDINTLVCTSLCCGWGKMIPKVSADQILKAYCDFMNDKIPIEIEHENDPCVFMTHSVDDEQPTCYDNREIQSNFINGKMPTEIKHDQEQSMFSVQFTNDKHLNCYDVNDVNDVMTNFMYLSTK
jgi:O-acetyl-ADP-ribose deacetylase (regulator of RNase III)